MTTTAQQATAAPATPAPGVVTVKCFGHTYQGTLVQLLRTRALVSWSNGKKVYRRKVRIVRTQAQLEACVRRCVLLPEALLPGAAEGTPLAQAFVFGQQVRFKAGYSASKEPQPLVVVAVHGRGWYRVRNRHGSHITARGSELEGYDPNEEGA